MQIKLILLKCFTIYNVQMKYRSKMASISLKLAFWIYFPLLQIQNKGKFIYCILCAHCKIKILDTSKRNRDNIYFIKGFTIYILNVGLKWIGVNFLKNLFNKQQWSCYISPPKIQKWIKIVSILICTQ